MSSGEHHPWPVVVSVDDAYQPLVLRPLRRSDRNEWHALRQANAGYVARWEPTPPDGQVPTVSFWRYVQNLNREARFGLTRPWVIELAGELVGQVHLFGIVRGSLQSAAVGYWVSEAHAGQGIATRTLAAVTTYALGPFGLHRVEVNIRPENAASLRVVEHLQFRDEGIRERFLHIEGAWRNHRTFALTREDTGGLPVSSRWNQVR
ncbi:MAG: GNAT family N-acetyltransferase [Actinomycetales bacterium]|nr:MAG: GNAT family N-acetyltransferase [Actinomycetales bacterium]